MIPLAPALLLSIGVAQWSVLRTVVQEAHRWIWITNGAWLVALPVTFLLPALLTEHSSFALQIAAWLFAGFAMAAILAAVTGFGLIRWILPGALAKKV